MKKLLVAIVAVLFAAPSFAQLSTGGFSISGDNLYYGFRIGFTSAKLAGDSPIDNVRMGFGIGGVIGVRLSENAPVFLESGLSYAERGSKRGKQRVGYQNLDIPLLIKYGFAVGDKFSILPLFGPVFSYAISGETKQLDVNNNKTNDMETVGTFDEKKANTGGLRRPNLGLKLGCGIEYSNIYAEAGYQFGLTNICKQGKWNPDGSIHSHNLFVNVGVNF